MFDCIQANLGQWYIAEANFKGHLYGGHQASKVNKLLGYRKQQFCEKFISQNELLKGKNLRYTDARGK